MFGGTSLYIKRQLQIHVDVDMLCIIRKLKLLLSSSPK